MYIVCIYVVRLTPDFMSHSLGFNCCFRQSVRFHPCIQNYYIKHPVSEKHVFVFDVSANRAAAVLEKEMV